MDWVRLCVGLFGLGWQGRLGSRYGLAFLGLLLFGGGALDFHATEEGLFHYQMVRFI